MVFEEIAFSARVAIWTRFWTLLASLLGACWPPRWLKPLLEFLLERPRAVQDFFFQPQERPKRLPRAPHKPLEVPPWPTKPFLELQEPSKSPPRGLQGQFGSHLGAILEQFLEPFWSNFKVMLPPCWSRFLAECSFAKGPASKVPSHVCGRSLAKGPQSNTPGPAEYA